MYFVRNFLIILASSVFFAGCAQQQKQVAATPPPAVMLEAAGAVPQAPGETVVTGDFSAEPSLPTTPAAPSEIQIAEAVFCTAVKDRIPQGVSGSFDADVKKVFFFTRVTQAKKPTTITHVWYWNERKMAEVPLEVRSENWRTWSSKHIEPAWKGDWAVKVLDENGEVVTTKNFQII